MADWKYIMWEANGRKIPVLFPNMLIHSEVAQSMGRAIRDHVVREARGNWSSKTLSAGFVSGLLVSGVNGKSESMGDLASIPEDRAVINTWPYTLGHEDLLGVEPMMFEAFKRSLD